MDSFSKNNGFTSEKEALEQLRAGLSDVLKPDVTDSVLMKWIRTNNFNIERTIRLYKQNLWARILYEIDDIESYRVPEVIQKYRIDTPLGYAKDGTPVSYLSIGKGDFKGFVNSLNVVDVCKYTSYCIEKDLRRCQEQSKKLGKEINSITYIADFADFSLRKVLAPGIIELGFDLFRTLQDHYPEVWNHILVINVPYYFGSMYNMFKPYLRQTFIQKIFLASKGNHADLLLKFIDPEELPSFLGGNLVDSYKNPMCYEFMNFGGRINQGYYITSRLKFSTTEPGVVDVWISPRHGYNYITIIREANSIMKVEYQAEGGSVGGRLFYRELPEDTEKLELPSTTEYLDHCSNDSPWKAISPYIRAPAHKVPFKYYSVAPWPGIYVIRFDNPGSWLYSRRIEARITVLPPGTKPNADFLQSVPM